MPETRKLSKAEDILLELFKARAAAKAEKARFAHAVQLRGGWKCRPDFLNDDDEENPDFDSAKEACWYRPTVAMCDDCRVLQPFYLASRKASAKAGSALRRATQEGWKLFQAHH